MADVQLKHGHTRIADTLLEALIRTPLPGRHKDVVLAIIRKTYGYQKTRDRISSSQIAEILGTDASYVRRALRDLVEWGIITRVGGGSGRGDAPMIHLVKNFEKWKVGQTSEARRRRPIPVKGAGDHPHIKGVASRPVKAEKRVVSHDKAGGTPPGKAGGTPPTQERERERDKNKGNGKPTPKRKSPPTADEFWVADYLTEKLLARHPGARIHRTAWARSIGKIKATQGEKVETIDWLFSTKNSTRDYPYVVHSGTSLQEKWSRIRETMGRGNKPRSAQAPPPPPAQETPTPATPEQAAEALKDQIGKLEIKVRAGEATGYDINRLHTLKNVGVGRKS